jgi:hypothetical protein
MKDIFSKNYWLVVLVFTVVISCTKTEVLEINPQDSYKYYPIEVGDFKIYQVISKNYAVGQKEKIDTVLRKEIVKSKTIDQSSTTFVIERQVKGKNDYFYKAELVYQVITSPQKILVGERNVYKVLLYFPIYKKAKWDVNEINGLDNDVVKIVDINADKLPQNLISTKNLAAVLGDSTNNAISFIVNQTIYSKDIGLIYREITDIAYCQENDQCLGKGIIESGKREFIKLLEFGKMAQ